MISPFWGCTSSLSIQNANSFASIAANYLKVSFKKCRRILKLSDTISNKVQASLTLHLRMAHQTGSSADRKHQCQFCRKKFANIGRKQAHEKLHQSDLSAGPAKSPDTRTVDSIALESEETKSLFVCPICDKTFKKVTTHVTQNVWIL